MGIDETHKNWSSLKKEVAKLLCAHWTGWIVFGQSIKASGIELFKGTDSAVNVPLSKHVRGAMHGLNCCKNYK